MIEKKSEKKSATENGSLKRAPPQPDEILPQMRYEYGTLDVDSFVQKLADHGIMDAKVEQRDSEFIIELVSVRGNFSSGFGTFGSTLIVLCSISV